MHLKKLLLFLASCLLGSCTTIVIQIPENNQEQTDPDNPNPGWPNGHTFEDNVITSFNLRLDEVDFNQYLTDSLFTSEKMAPGEDAFGWEYWAFHFHTDSDNNIDGGCRVSFSQDYVPFEKISSSTAFPKYWSTYDPHWTNGSSQVNSPSDGFILYYANPNAQSRPTLAMRVLKDHADTCRIISCNINNTAQGVKAMKHKCKSGDFVKVIARGFADGKETGKAEIMLADMTRDKQFIIQEWTPFDLRALGKIDAVNFEWISNNPAIEPYFCIDDIWATFIITDKQQ